MQNLISLDLKDTPIFFTDKEDTRLKKAIHFDAIGISFEKEPRG